MTILASAGGGASSRAGAPGDTRERRRVCVVTGATQKHVEAMKQLVSELVSRAGDAGKEEALALGDVGEWGRRAIAKLTCAEAGKQEL